MNGVNPLRWSWGEGALRQDSNLHFDVWCASCCRDHGYPKRCPWCGGVLHGEAARGGDREHAVCCATCGVAT